jgi:hypothetical protein
MIGWIVEADPTILAGDELQTAGVPQDSAGLVVALSAPPMKNDEIVHGLIADAVIPSLPCRRRIGHLLRVLSDIAAGRDLPEGAAAREVHGNGVTNVWTFNNAFPGI